MTLTHVQKRRMLATGHLSQHTYTYVKAAATHDSLLESQNGNSKWSMSYIGLKLHTLRNTHDAFLAGVYSILQYKPFLTTRLPHGGKNPIRYCFK